MNVFNLKVSYFFQLSIKFQNPSLRVSPLVQYSKNRDEETDQNGAQSKCKVK